MPRRIHQIEDVILTVTGAIVEPYRLGLDGDTPFALDIHIVEHLFLHLTLAKSAAKLDKAVSKSRFAVINMGNDRKIADVFEWRHQCITNRTERKTAHWAEVTYK